jgi:hypothetical protein
MNCSNCLKDLSISEVSRDLFGVCNSCAERRLKRDPDPVFGDGSLTLSELGAMTLWKGPRSYKRAFEIK